MLKFVKSTIEKCRQNNNDVDFALLQIRPIPLGSPAKLLFQQAFEGAVTTN